jgi:mannose/cellobiose epimerase-like protein (N-acyl-D-glucosamine 2-epimerase family)
LTHVVPAPLDTGYFTRDAIASSLKRWTVELALPFWSSRGLDPRGGFIERLHLDGSVDLSASRRTRVQARQIYVYAHASALGWYPEGLPIALDALEFVLDRCRAPDGSPGYVHLLAPDGGIANPLRDTYDHAFLLLAFGWLAQASGDAQVHALVDELLAFCDQHLAVGDGTLQEGVPASVPRRQNPHMHMFEAMLALHQTLNHPIALSRAAALRALLKARFFDPETRTLGEYFTADWAPTEPAATRAVEPGHHAEWTWLLRRHEDLAALPRDPLARELLDFAVRTAQTSGALLVDETDTRGVPRAGTRRLWPQTELAKAWLAECGAGDAEAGAAAERTLRAIATEHLCACPAGTWIDRFDGSGRPAVDHIPASTLYHLFVAIAEADRVLAGSPA